MPGLDPGPLRDTTRSHAAHDDPCEIRLEPVGQLPGERFTHDAKPSGGLCRHGVRGRSGLRQRRGFPEVALAQHHVNRERDAFPQDVHRRGFIGPGIGNRELQIRTVLYGSPVEPDDDVAAPEPGSGCGRLGTGIVGDDGAPNVLVEIKRCRDLGVDQPYRHSEPTARDLSLGGEVVVDTLHQVRRNGEAKSDVSRAAHRLDHRVYPDEASVQADERAPGVPEVDGRVSLDEILVVAAEHPALRAHDARRDRVAVSERIADGEHPFTDLNLIRVSQREVRKGLPIGLQADHGQVSRGVLPHDLRLDGSTVGKLHLDAGRPVHHMVVGDDEPTRVHDGSGSAAHLRSRRPRSRWESEETLQPRIRRARGGFTLHEQTYHSRRSHPRHFGEGVGEGPRSLGPGAVRCLPGRRYVRQPLMGRPLAGTLPLRSPLPTRRGRRQALELGALREASGGGGQHRKGQSRRQESKHEQGPPSSGHARNRI